MSRQLNIGVGLLSWRAPETLRYTLSALTAQVKADQFEDAVVFAQECADEDRRIAADHGFRIAGNEKNVGIMRGIKAAVDLVQADIVLFLECDCLLIESCEAVVSQLEKAADCLRRGDVDVVRTNHLKNPGGEYLSTKFTRYWPDEGEADKPGLKMRRFFRPLKAKRMIGRSCQVYSKPEIHFPGIIERIDRHMLKMDSAYLNWTNQAIMFRKAWFMEKIIPFAESHLSSRTVNGFPDLEKEMNSSWWRKQHFSIGWLDPGLFSHYRMDRPEGDEKTAVHASTCS